VQSPQDIAPTIFELAWRKNNTVAQGLNNGKWMQGLQRMATPEQIQQFIKVWTLAAQVQRTEEPDKITWRFTTNGVYAQFIGSTRTMTGIESGQHKLSTNAGFSLG
jgi:hypothetical protein